MPWPFLPPNPDTKPASYDDDIFVFSLTLTGMSPHDEQTDHRFSVDGTSAGVWVPLLLNSSSHKYGGVGMVPLSTIGSTALYKGTYLPASQTNTHSIQVSTASMSGSVSNLSAQQSGTKVLIDADYSVSGSGWYVVAAPYATAMPAFTSLGVYQALGDVVSVSGSGSVTLTVYPSGVSQYVVFIAKGYPSELEPGSAGQIITV